MRRARVEGLRAHFLAAQFIADGRHAADADEESTHDDIEDNQHQRKPTRKSTNDKKENKRRLSKRSSVVVEAAAIARRGSKEEVSAEPAFIRDFKGVEHLPFFVREEVLLKHVTEMQRTFAHRVSQWEKKKEERQMAEDLAGVFYAEGDEKPAAGAASHRPTVIELHRLRRLYADTYDAWVRGDFDHRIHYFRRVQKNVFGRWKRGTHHDSTVPRCAADSTVPRHRRPSVVVGNHHGQHDAHHRQHDGHHGHHDTHHGHGHHDFQHASTDAKANSKPRQDGKKLTGEQRSVSNASG